MTVEVKGINYNIHRKLMVTDEIPFTKFARIIVTAMGWAGWRNWEFQVNNMNIMVPPDDDADREKSSSQRLHWTNAFTSLMLWHLQESLGP